MTEITTSAFLNKGSVKQFTHILSLYPTALKLKADTKPKPAELIKLDEWYQTALPKTLKSRNPAHLTHDELINLIKWKQTRGKFRPKLRELVTMNSPRVVMADSKKAFRALQKKGDLNVAVSYLCNLKGIGPSTASAILTAYAPQTAAFMADECLAAVPEIEGIDCSIGEYLDLMRYLRDASARLSTSTLVWTPHQVELALWTHYTLLMLKPELLQEDGAEDAVLPADAEDSNPLDLHNGIGLNGGPPSAQDLDDEASFPISDEPNSNSSQYSKNHESDPGSPTYNSQLPRREQTQVEIDSDVNASTEVTATYCSKDQELDTFEPDRKRVKVD